MASIIEVAEGLLEQAVNEEIIYTITTTNFGSSPSTSSASAVDLTTGQTVTTTVFPTNTPSEAGDVITLSALKSLVKGHKYEIRVKFTSGSNIFECLFYVECVA